MISLKPLQPDDREALETLLAEIYAYYFGEPQDQSTITTAASSLIESKYTDTVVAWDGKHPLGLTIFTFLQPTRGRGGALFMKELFVSESARNQGLGRRLIPTCINNGPFGAYRQATGVFTHRLDGPSRGYRYCAFL